jgi:serine/threonine protein phosphatase PrpC
LSECFECGQRRILEEQMRQNLQNGIKTTLVCLSVDGANASWGHVGDSRLYHFVGDRMAGRTLDHSVPQMLVAAGEIREKDIRHHEDRNRLIRVMGIEWPSPRYELASPVPLSGKDSFLLCSDGFWEHVLEKDMRRCLKAAGSPAEWLESMAAIAARNADAAKRDNFSAIAVFSRFE